MLVLSRKVNEVIQIGENIEIKVSKIKGNLVRLAISAPSEIRVLRGELSHLNGKKPMVRLSVPVLPRTCQPD